MVPWPLLGLKLWRVVVDLGFGDPWTEGTCGPIFCQEFWEGTTKVEQPWLEGRSKLRAA